ncbi:hypothetical protein [Flavobacterium daemonense]|uniref:hypothetical protein n=1 Tax=Flavobacterium daemonense TaxID=1393049 RepID=UPI0011849B6A|nr:hypothetical protein [Flavobacterium daemonense]KAF2334841.1 hypothetical protein FND99_06420 [Flavobacterium daemonense]
MIKKLLNYKEYLPIIALIMYGFGYIYQKIFYSHFGIEIEYYTSFSDLLFFTVNFIVFIGFLLLLTEIILMILTHYPLLFFFKHFYKSQRKKYNSDEEFYKKEVEERVEENYTGSSLIILTFILIWAIFFAKEFVYPFSIYFCLFIIKFHKLVKKWNPEDDKIDIGISLAEVFTSMFFFFFLLILIFFAFKDAKDLKENKSNKKIEFCDNEKQYSTLLQSNLIYIGETSNYLFLYDKQLKTSSVFNKNNIGNFTIVDPTIITKEEMDEINSTKNLIEKIINPK